MYNEEEEEEQQSNCFAYPRGENWHIFRLKMSPGGKNSCLCIGKILLKKQIFIL